MSASLARGAQLRVWDLGVLKRCALKISFWFVLIWGDRVAERFVLWPAQIGSSVQNEFHACPAGHLVQIILDTCGSCQCNGDVLG